MLTKETPQPTTDSERWRAVLDRDTTADGSFFYAVRTTRIYCRPSCPAKRPHPENVLFFNTPHEAEGAGFRPCKRCRPTEVAATQQLVAQVQGLLETTDPEPSLAELAERLNMSPYHLQRTFKRATGLSPKQYALARREAKLKEGLKRGKTVTTALYEAGYGSSHALYSTQTLGMNPKDYRDGGAGETIHYGFFDSRLGTMLVAATAKGLVAIRFGEDEALLAELRAEFPKGRLEPDTAPLTSYAEALGAYLEGRAKGLDLELAVVGTDFQRRVWEALRNIPYGETCSYSDIAQAIGQPAAVRAVARACATNPVALAIPCHRVVRASGALSGYRWGVGVKERLLEGEKEGRGV